MEVYVFVSSVYLNRSTRVAMFEFRGRTDPIYLYSAVMGLKKKTKTKVYV